MTVTDPVTIADERETGKEERIAAGGGPGEAGLRNSCDDALPVFSSRVSAGIGKKVAPDLTE